MTRFTIILRDVGDSPSKWRRLRALLKIMLRAFKFRCESIVEHQVE